VANDLANLNTSGYRGQQPTFRSLLAGGESANPLNRAINDFNITGGTRLDLSTGSLERTGNPLDLAIEGQGFFAVQTRAGILYTRNGAFQVSASGELVTGEGDPVLGEQGVLQVPSGPLSISADGTLSVKGAVAGKLRLAQFAPDVALTPEGTNLYRAPVGAAPSTAQGSVRQAMREASNVSPVGAVVALISVQRHAEMLQRALSQFYGEFNRIAATDIPRV
jgi:flagellar basal-body rod protein FlgF/flagellar basal-body rod protein FlgG